MNNNVYDDYIKNQKNKYDLIMENKKLKNRIDKAIEHIEHAQNYGTMAQVMPHLKLYVNGDDLLDILKGE